MATFHETAPGRSLPHFEIRRAIEQAAQDFAFQSLRIEEVPMILKPDQREEAQALGEQYKASMVIWGQETEVRITVNFLNLKEQNYAGADVEIHEIERNAISKSIDTQFITEDLPGQLTFLALFALGQSYYLAEDYADAVTAIEQGVNSLLPNAQPQGLDEAYFRLGWLYQVPLNMRTSTTAISYYTEASRLNPALAPAYTNRGNTFLKLEEYEKAMADYDEAIRLNPAYAAAYYNRGLAYIAMGDTKQGVTELETGLQFDQNLARRKWVEDYLKSLEE